MKFVYSDGGRSNYFKAANVRDCVTRAICNATGKDYKEVYDALNSIAKTSRKSKRERGTSTSRNGVHTRIAKKYIEDVLGWNWVACMGIGTGCQVHLDGDELPKNGNLILNLSKHFSCIKDGVLYDTYDCTRGGTRCVYGYWVAPTSAQLKEREENQRAMDTAKAIETKYIEKAKSEIDVVNKKYQPTISKLEKKIKELTHQLKLEQNRKNREIGKIKKDNSMALQNAILELE